MAKCSSCPAGIVWAKSPTGANLPLDEQPVDVGALIAAGGRWPTLYALEVGGSSTPSAVKVDQAEAMEAEYSLYVSHFTTCPAARQFSGRGRS